MLLAARQNKALVCVHAENHGMISWMGKQLVENGYTAPKYHTISAPARCGGRGIQSPDHIRGARRPADHDLPCFNRRGRGGHSSGPRPRSQGVRRNLPAVPVHDRKRPRQAGPRRRQVDVLAAAAGRDRSGSSSGRGWRSATCRSISSDHAPYAFDKTGKLSAGPNPSFKQIANGLPGIGARLPLLFDAMVSQGRLGLAKFVELTATAPAKIYNLHPTQRFDRHWRGCRYRGVGSQEPRHFDRYNVPRSRRLHALCRTDDYRMA